MAKFKVGDRVRLIQYDSPFPPGAEGVIISYISGLSFPYKIRVDDREGIVAEASLELIAETTREAHAFKVGDKVRVIDHRPDNADNHPTWSSGMDAYAGRIGTIFRAVESIFCVRFEDDEWWGYRPEWLIPISEKPGGIVAAIRDAFIPKHDNPIKGNLPLLRQNTLLTNIKLD